MRIISEHRDYYDCVQAQGQDQTCVWVRDLEELEFKWPFPAYKTPWRHTRSGYIYIIEHIVGFCGKIYPVLAVKKSGTSCHDNLTFCYKAEDVAKFVEANFKPKQIKSFYEPNKYRWRDRNDIDCIYKMVSAFFDEAKLVENNFEQMFYDNGCPVFIATYDQSRKSKIVFHGRKPDPERPEDNAKKVKSRSQGYLADRITLAELHFYKIFPTEQAYQEIWQYISGILGLNNPHVPVPDDKTMRDIKGFDNWSFKKEPSKRKKKEPSKRKKK